MTHEQADAEAVEAAAWSVHQARSRPSDTTWDDTTAFWRGICRTEAQAAITAYLAAMEARGFVMAPVEPTPLQMTAAAILSVTTDDAIYRAMLAARPRNRP